jgi:hypothetical protein
MNSRLFRTGFSVFLILLYSIVRPEAHESQAELVPFVPEDPPFLEVDHAWADSVLETLSLEERIAQMIMVYGYSNMGPDHQRAVLRQIRRQ